MKIMIFICFCIIFFIGCIDATKPSDDKEENIDSNGVMVSIGGEEFAVRGGEEVVPDIDGFGFGEDCYGPADCESRLCFSDGFDDIGLCTVSCDDLSSDCPESGWECLTSSTLGDICVPIEELECSGGIDYCDDVIEEEISLFLGGFVSSALITNREGEIFIGGIWGSRGFIVGNEIKIRGVPFNLH